MNFPSLGVARFNSRAHRAGSRNVRTNERIELGVEPGLRYKLDRRVAARFDEAVGLAEQTFTDELSNLISHLTERLSGEDDGKRKIFRDSAIENLREFFERFRALNIRSNDQLDDLVAQAQRTVRGVQPQELRDNVSLRQRGTT